MLHTFPDSSGGKESACNAGDPGSIPVLERSPGEGKGYPLQYLAWRIPWTVYGLATFTFHFQTWITPVFWRYITTALVSFIILRVRK